MDLVGGRCLDALGVNGGWSRFACNVAVDHLPLLGLTESGTDEGVNAANSRRGVPLLRELGVHPVEVPGRELRELDPPELGPNDGVRDAEVLPQRRG